LSAAKGGIKLEKDQDITSVTLYLPACGVGQLAAIVAEHRDLVAAEAAKKEPKPVLPQDRVAAVLRSKNGTIQLLGRMLAELPGGEVDGAVQFAHASPPTPPWWRRTSSPPSTTSRRKATRAART
jgi:CRISPR system Cascade subunit CasC